MIRVEYEHGLEPETIKLPSGLEYKPKYKPKEVIFLDDRVIYQLLNSGEKFCENDNIYCIDNHGNFLWQIESKFAEDYSAPYVAIKIDEETGHLLARNFRSADALVDVNTGKIIKIWQRKPYD